MFAKGKSFSLKSVGNGLVSLLFPSPCRVCGALLETASRLPLCERCLDSMELVPGLLCHTCGRPLHSITSSDTSKLLCHLCRRGVYAFDFARSFAIYNDCMIRAITVLKYEAVTSLGDWFAARLSEIVRCNTELQAVDLIIPIPLDPSRLRQRGYNQAELIARPLAKRLRLPARSGWMKRTRPRPNRLKLTRSERWRTVRGAFEVAGSAGVDKLRVLLVDDVFTTGATLDACARTLLCAGASNVCGLTVARVVSDWLSPGATREKR